MRLEMYLFYGLALRSALSESLDLDVGVSMTLLDASNRLRDNANNFWLFENTPETFIRPKIMTRTNPFDVTRPFWIEEIHFMLKRSMHSDDIVR
ncbi:hypothetical protein OROGR_009378 [Orobanche gracilis]